MNQVTVAGQFVESSAKQHERFFAATGFEQNAACRNIRAGAQRIIMLATGSNRLVGWTVTRDRGIAAFRQLEIETQRAVEITGNL